MVHLLHRLYGVDAPAFCTARLGRIRMHGVQRYGLSSDEARQKPLGG